MLKETKELYLIPESTVFETGGSAPLCMSVGNEAPGVGDDTTTIYPW